MKHLNRYLNKLSVVFTVSLLGSFLVIGGAFNLTTVMAQNNYLPMNNPGTNIAQNPVVAANGNCLTFNSSTNQWNGMQNAACSAVEITTINNAQEQLGEPAINLPSNWQLLSNPERLFVFLSLERISLGLPPYVGMDSSLNTAAQMAANNNEDPSLPAGWPDALDTNGLGMYGGAWSGGYPGMGTLMADYGWFYADGWGGTGSTYNLACTSASSDGCWAHRDELLGETDYGTAPQTWGVGLDCTTCVVGAGSANNDGSTALLVAKPSVSDSSLNLSFTWTQEVPFLSNITTPIGPEVIGISPSSGSVAGGTTVTISGAGFVPGATTVSFGGIPVSVIDCGSSNSCNIITPASGVGTVAVVVMVNGQKISGNIQFTYVGESDTTGSEYVPLTPMRVLDTRVTKNNLGTNSYLTFNFLDESVPSDATAVAINVTATETTTSSYLSIYPAGKPLPLVSNLNWVAGQTVANLVIVPLGNKGEVNFYNDYGTVAVLVDLEGYFIPNSVSASKYVVVKPSRIADTRTDSGYPDAGMALGANSVLNVQATGVGSVPTSGVTSVLLNVTATNTTSASYFTVYPEGGIRPLVSNLNWTSGKTVANMVIVPVNLVNGQISIYNANGAVDAVVDVVGYFTSQQGAGELYYPLSPFRAIDTRTTGQVLEGGSAAILSLTSSGSVPSGAVAVITNITATDTTNNSYFSVYPYGSSSNTSSVNWRADQTASNLAIVTLGSYGNICVYNANGEANLIIDVFGYFG